MAPGPLHVDTDSVRSHGQDLTSAAEDASTQLASTRTDADTAEPGFPGEAAAPFRAMIRSLGSKDRSLVRSIDETGKGVEGAAGSYEYCEAQNEDLLSTIRIEF
ncbi:MAG: hypothetical protein L0H31_03730 [Nocardioidaceae bacterium]|uniref:WXG100 family type VII secretion target n=1 Tax=Corynebacterium sp. TaxID=1720 RepID=UPI002647095B|nr:type VII secretion target [Corynebacterium sp.]MDN5722032.1 hypothetical protein [Corynebacterium sp.]MDN5744215.1 hypothetical protein [Nocardioidaceae bacterium]